MAELSAQEESTVGQIKLTISYDGTDFYGFQAQNRQENPVRTVQGVLEKTLEKVVKTAVPVTGAGRTDAGVHAREQVVTFPADGVIPVNRWPRLLNHRLPRDIVITGAEAVPATFHPRYDAVAKVYRYTIETAEIPDIFTRRFSTHLPGPLDVGEMRAAAHHLVGTHDFTSFSAARAQVRHRVRTLKNITIRTDNTRIHITFEGDGFLQHMVRILTGTLVEVGSGDIQAEDVPHILAAKDRKAAGRTMPPEGLSLWQVKYS